MERTSWFCPKLLTFILKCWIVSSYKDLFRSQIHETVEQSTVSEWQGIFSKQRDLELGSKAVDVLQREKYTVQDRKTYAKPGLVIQLVENKCSWDMLELYSN